MNKNLLAEKSVELYKSFGKNMSFQTIQTITIINSLNVIKFDIYSYMNNF